MENKLNDKLVPHTVRFMSRPDLGGVNPDRFHIELMRLNQIDDYEKLLKHVREEKEKVSKPYQVMEDIIVEKLKKLKDG